MKKILQSHLLNPVGPSTGNTFLFKDAKNFSGILSEFQLTKGPVPYTNATRQLSRVVMSRYMGPGVTTTVGSICTTSQSGRET